MTDLLQHGFALVCGQNPWHTWAPGGLPLPCCQRCTGFYAGAGVAAWLHWWLRPRLSGRFLEIHAVFLMLMAPFGFHWLAHGALVRAITGVLFGFGVVSFLWTPLSGQAGRRDADLPSGRTGAYGLGLAAAVVGLPLGGFYGGQVAAYALSGLAGWGLLAITVLVAANLLAGLRGILRRFSRARRLPV